MIASDRLPHQWPGMPEDGGIDLVAWKCSACGYWVREYGRYKDQPGCAVDWRAT